MRHRLLQPLALAVLLACGAGTAAAQDYTISWNPRSGDVWVDTWLSDVNRYGSRYRDPFVDEMVRYHGAPRDLVTELLVTRNWAPGDVYYACALARVIGRPCGYVADYWQQHHGQGWGVVAQRLGVKPGSPEFHRLKRGFVPSYDRWSRPITLDADLQRAYPNRGKRATAADAPRAAGKPGPGKAGTAAKGGAQDKAGPPARAKPAQRPAGKPDGQGGGKGPGNAGGKGNGKAGGKGNGKG